MIPKTLLYTTGSFAIHITLASEISLVNVVMRTHPRQHTDILPNNHRAQPSENFHCHGFGSVIPTIIHKAHNDVMKAMPLHPFWKREKSVFGCFAAKAEDHLTSAGRPGGPVHFNCARMCVLGIKRGPAKVTAYQA